MKGAIWKNYSFLPLNPKHILGLTGNLPEASDLGEMQNTARVQYCKHYNACEASSASFECLPALPWHRNPGLW